MSFGKLRRRPWKLIATTVMAFFLRCGAITSAGWKRQHGDKDMPSKTGEALLVPGRNHRSRVDRITGSTGKSGSKPKNTRRIEKR